ncbi:MAG: histidine kinase [Mariniphaga sp.]|nr:histidine kinase [Mariniphaga sp.]
MQKNIVFNTIFLRNYLVFATVVSLVWFALIHFRYDIPAGFAAADAVVSVFVLCAMLLSLYFVVKFARTESLTSLISIRNSVFAGLLIVGVWLFFTRWTLDQLFYNYHLYSDFLFASQALRFIAGLFLAGMVYLSFFLAVYQESVKEAIERESELRELIRKTELQALKNQLNPHFIYNTLNSISSLTMYSPEKAREMTALLSDFLRIALRQDAMQMAHLKDELSNISLYLQIEKVRFEEKLTWEFRVDEQHMAYKLPVMILQPLVENAVKHGVQQSPEPGPVKVISSMKEGILELKVVNTFDAGFHRFKGEGVGLENVRNRLRIIYGRSDLISTGAKDGIFTVVMRIPVG